MGSPAHGRERLSTGKGSVLWHRFTAVALVGAGKGEGLLDVDELLERRANHAGGPDIPASAGSDSRIAADAALRPRTLRKRRPAGRNSSQSIAPA